MRGRVPCSLPGISRPTRSSLVIVVSVGAVARPPLYVPCGRHGWVPCCSSSSQVPCSGWCRARGVAMGLRPPVPRSCPSDTVLFYPYENKASPLSIYTPVYIFSFLWIVSSKIPRIGLFGSRA